MGRMKPKTVTCGFDAHKMVVGENSFYAFSPCLAGHKRFGRQNHNEGLVSL